MNEVLDKHWYLEKNEELNGYIALKYVKEISPPIIYFCNGKRYTCLDNGYSILEYVPIDKNYNCRVFFDTLNRPLSFYFDINNGNGIENGIPWYDDLYLDVIMECTTITECGNFIRLEDVREFEAAKKEGLIDEKAYAMGYDTAIKLMQELKEQRNEIVNRCQFDLYRIKQSCGIQ